MTVAETDTQSEVKKTTEMIAEEEQQPKHQEVDVENPPPEDAAHDTTELSLQVISNQPLEPVSVEKNAQATQAPDEGLLPNTMEVEGPQVESVDVVNTSQNQVLVDCS